MDEEKKKPKSRSTHTKKKRSGKSHISKIPTRHTNSGRRRRRKSKVINQNSVEDVPCFKFPLLDLLCGCNRICWREKKKLKKTSNNKYSSRHCKKTRESVQIISEGSNFGGNTITKNNPERSSMNMLQVDGIPDVFNEPIPLENIKLNGSMKQLLANVKLTSVFGYPHVPKTMSQIKLLLDSNPNLKYQLRQILGQSLKNENMKAIYELLASEKNSEVSESKSSIDTDKHSCMEVRNTAALQSFPSSQTLLRNLKHLNTSNDDETGSKRKVVKSRSSKSRRFPGSETTKKNDDSSDSQSVFGKIIATLFGSKSSKQQDDDVSRKNVVIARKHTRSKIKSFSMEIGTIDVREQYSDWCQHMTTEVKERFCKEDYATVKKYFNNNLIGGSDGERVGKPLFNQWVQSISRGVNDLYENPDGDISQVLNPFADVGNDATSNIHPNIDVSQTSPKEDRQRENPSEFYQKTLSKIKSDEMLNIDGGGRDVITRLNCLMDELLDNNTQPTSKTLQKVALEESVIEERDKNKDQPCCSKLTGNDEETKMGVAPEEDQTLEQMMMMCATFVEKLSSFKSSESNGIMMSQETPWLNKDFQVFCVPNVETGHLITETSPVQSEDLVTNGTSSEYEGRLSSNSTFDFNEDETNIFSENPEVQIQNKCLKCDLISPQQSENNLEGALSNISENNDGENDKNELTKSENDDYSRHSKHSLQHKKVSFEDNPNIEYISYENSAIDISQSNTDDDDYDQLSRTQETDFDSDRITDQEGHDSIEFSLSHSVAESFDEDIFDECFLNVFDQSSENYKFIEEHKIKLMEMLKYLLSMSNVNANVLQLNQDKSGRAFNSVPQCVGIQCKLSEESSSMIAYTERDEKMAMDIAINGPSLFKLKLDSTSYKVRSECEVTDNGSVKLNSSSSDSGVYSKSSTTSNRRFISLPDVLDCRAPAVVSTENSLEEEVNYEEIERSSNSYHSTSASCKAAQIQDVDYISECSISDLSESNIKERSSQLNKIPSIEKCESSENTQSSLDSSNSNVIRHKLARLLRKLKNK